jgi:hypothetical protein
VDTAKGKKDRELRLVDGSDTLFLTPDGKTLYASAPADRSSREGTVQVIDPLKMELRKTFTISAAPFDLAATDAGLLFVSGGAGDWTDIAVVDVKNEAVLARWGGVWRRSFVRLARDQDRLYVATQGVAPGQVEAILIPGRLDEKPVQYKSSAATEHALGGDFVLTPDGRFLLCKTGTVLRLSKERDEDLKYFATIEPFLAAVVAPDLGLVLTANKDSTLRAYSYPDFKPQTIYRIGAIAYQVALDAQQGRLYAAAFDPKTLTERPRGKSAGGIHVYDLKDLLSAK